MTFGYTFFLFSYIFLGDDILLLKVGDLVTRKSHNHDMVFKIIEINGHVAILKGYNVRLIADSDLDDLEISRVSVSELVDEDRNLFDRMSDLSKLDRDEYFYIPGKILHIDADEDYLNRCMEFYKKINILAYGLLIKEKDIYLDLERHLEEIKPDVLVITGHDAYYDKSGNEISNFSNYKNSDNFAKAVRIARKYEKDHDKLIIIAGACQSDYEELIKSGANFASSPRRINIHALDPAIIASSVCLSDKSKPINLLKILDKTKYGKDGIGGIITNGVMYVGYPR